MRAANGGSTKLYRCSIHQLLLLKCTTPIQRKAKRKRSMPYIRAQYVFAKLFNTYRNAVKNVSKILLEDIQKKGRYLVSQTMPFLLYPLRPVLSRLLKYNKRCAAVNFLEDC